MSKVFYILRHGQTELNLKGMVQGRGVDASLNSTGQEQALKVYKSFGNRHFDRIYTSSLKRTHETVKYFDQEKISLEGLDEISWGNQEGVVPTEQSKNLYAETLQAWRDGNLHANVGGGESPLEVMERQKKAMEKVFKNGGDTILICMHGRAMRILLSWLTDSPLEKMDQFDHGNCCYYKLDYSGGKFEILERNRCLHLTSQSPRP